MSIDSDFNLMKDDSFNNVLYAWMKTVSQQTKQNGYLEDSYQPSLLMKCYAQTAQRTKLKTA